MTKRRDATTTSTTAKLMARVSSEIEARKLSLPVAAAEIGVTLATLLRHVDAEHVRSDSERKYEDWLAGRARRSPFGATSGGQSVALPLVAPYVSEPDLPPSPTRPHLVVDLFAGCGGLSLGFDLLDGGKQFRTILALDIEPAPIAVLNRNHGQHHAGSTIGRVVDLTEFLNEHEILAFYMLHVVNVLNDTKVRAQLHSLGDGELPRFLQRLHVIDATFLEELSAVRTSAAYQKAYDGLDKGVLSQTSVIGFHNALKLPRSARSRPSLPVVLWADVSQSEGHLGTISLEVSSDSFQAEAETLWDRELFALEAKRQATGKGQLTSSARRIKAFVDFANLAAFAPVRTAWCRWQAARLAVRDATFGQTGFGTALRSLYEQTYPVSVLLGGPPCQGFSRIGRGKIRSLRDAHVHVHGDEDAGDSRNHLYQRYLLVASALRPIAFKFENVQHFQSSVKTDGGEFLATEILAEAIAAMSEGAASYAVSSRTVDASRHGVPQTRQRFFMAGLRRDAFREEEPEALAARCLALSVEPDVPLSAALDGLPPPSSVGGNLSGGTGMTDPVALADHPDPDPLSSAARYRAWIRQPAPGETDVTTRTDAHAARAAREDDAALFSLFGPGKRWMDYRVDEAATLATLRRAMEALATLSKTQIDRMNRALPEGLSQFPPPEENKTLVEAIDGSLALRLLMEQVGERLEAPHHLVSETYLSKRDGNHGDWLARLDGQRPCKTIVAHMGKDTYGYVHPSAPRTLSVREAARVQCFPDWFSFGGVALTDALRMIGNAVPPLLSNRIAARVAEVLARARVQSLRALEAAE